MHLNAISIARISTMGKVFTEKAVSQVVVRFNANLYYFIMIPELKKIPDEDYPTVDRSKIYLCQNVTAKRRHHGVIAKHRLNFYNASFDVCRNQADAHVNNPMLMLFNF